MAAPMATTSSGLTPLWGILAEELLHHFLIFGMRVMPPTERPRRSGRHMRPASLRAALQARDRALHEIVDELLELGARQLHRQVLRAGLVRRDEGQVDLGLRRGRQLDLGLLGGFLQTLSASLSVFRSMP